MTQLSTEMTSRDIWDFEIKDQEGDRNCEHSIAESFEATRFHGNSLPDR